MSYIMTGYALAARVVDIAQQYKTIYMYATYGFQVTTATIKNKAAQNLNGWYTKSNIAKLEAVANQHPPTWGFDCVNLIKGVLWGWTGDESKEKGGAVYAANGVPDTNADGMIKRCSGVTDDFSHIEVGEVVWMPGHIGVYIGDGMAAECTPRWSDGVQITAVLNVGKIDGLNGRKWTKHGRLPWVDYGDAPADDVEIPDYALGARLLKRGCTGEDVRELQKALIRLGFSCGPDGADGEFGKDTEAAVKAFQTAAHIGIDGIFGPATLAALTEALDRMGDVETEPKYTATLRDLTESDVAFLREKWPDCEVTEE